MEGASITADVELAAAGVEFVAGGLHRRHGVEATARGGVRNGGSRRGGEMGGKEEGYPLFWREIASLSPTMLARCVFAICRLPSLPSCGLGVGWERRQQNLLAPAKNKFEEAD